MGLSFEGLAFKRFYHAIISLIVATFDCGFGFLHLIVDTISDSITCYSQILLLLHLIVGLSFEGIQEVFHILLWIISVIQSCYCQILQLPHLIVG